MTDRAYTAPRFDRTPAPRWVAPAFGFGLAALWLVIIGQTFPFGFNAEEVAQFGSPTRSGDFPHFFLAGKAAAEGENIYESWTGGYVYPPLLAGAMRLLVPLGMTLAAWIWYVLILGLLALVGWWSIAELARRLRIPLDLEARLGAMLIASIAVVDAFRAMMDLAQTDSIMLLGYAAPLLLLGRGTEFGDAPRSRERPWLAGVLIALALHIKFTAIGLMPYNLLTRRWTLIGATSAGVIALAFVTVPIFGLERNFEYLGVATARVGHVIGLPAPTYGSFDPHPIDWERSRSITSGAARIATQTGWGTPATAAIAGAVFSAWLGGAAAIYRLHGVSFVGRLLNPASVAPGMMRTLLIAEWINLVGAMMALGPQTTKRHALVIVPGLVLAALLVLVARSPSARFASLIGILLVGGASLLPPSPSFEISGPADIFTFLGAAGGYGWAIFAFSLLMLHAVLSEHRARTAE